METGEFRLRPIEERDNAAIANIIRRSLEEFGANHYGTVYYDSHTDQLFGHFKEPGAAYFIVEKNGEVMGCGGIFPTDGLSEGTCELVKMYLSPAARGRGVGKCLLQLCLDTAKEMGYQKIYLESMPELVKAIPLYEKSGFTHLDAPLGNSGHYACAIRMIRDL
jgi:putative acetyltransferase